MRILYFIESLFSGGRERRLVELLKGLDSKYPNIKKEIVITRENIHYNDIFSLNIKIHIIKRKGSKNDPRLFWKFYKIVRKFKPDIIHVWGNVVAIYALPSAKLFNIKIINSMITTASPDWKFFSKKWFMAKIAFSFSDVIVANSLAGLISHKVTKKGIFIYNGFDFNRIKNLDSKDFIRKRFKIDTKYVVGMVANITEKKDYITFVKTALKILEKRKDITFISVGNFLENGKKNKYYLKCIKLIPPNLMRYIKFLGRQKNVESIINIFDIGMLSTYSEGISNSIMEYMALKKPVVVSKGGGTRELVLNNITGFLVKKNSPENFAKYISLLLSDDSLRYEMGKKGFERIYQYFNLSIMIEKYKFLYDKVANNNKEKYKMNL